VSPVFYGQITIDMNVPFETSGNSHVARTFDLAFNGQGFGYNGIAVLGIARTFAKRTVYPELR
jgi:hypothetical protein